MSDKTICVQNEQSTCSSLVISDINNLTRSDLYQIKIQNMVDGIRSKNLNQLITIEREDNKKFLARYQEFANNLIPIHTFEPKKLVIPVIPKIQIEKTDTPEIKKLIRKINIKTQSFTCDHTKSDKKFDSFEADVGKIYLSKEMKEIQAFLKEFAETLSIMEKEDRNNDSAYIYSCNIGIENIMSINDKIIAINSKLIELESFFKSLKCYKCERIEKEYKVTLEMIEEMREEVKEELELARQMQEECNEDIAEDKYNVSNFMKTHYPTINRILLKDVCDKYFDVFGIKKTLVDMKQELEQYNFKITNVSRKFYVNKV